MSDAQTRWQQEVEDAAREALQRLEAGDAGGAHAILAAVLGGAPAPAREPEPEAGGTDLPGLSEAELEQAIEGAAPETDRMLHADQVARAAMREADRELVAEAAAALEEVAPSFATETMAEVLERQGDAAGASRIRASLGRGGHEAGRPSRLEVIATLERWLENIREGAGA